MRLPSINQSRQWERTSDRQEKPGSGNNVYSFAFPESQVSIRLIEMTTAPVRELAAELRVNPQHHSQGISEP